MEPTIFSSTLGLIPPWQVTAIALSQSEDRLDITVVFDSIFRSRCPECGAIVPTVPVTREVWYHDSFFQHPTYLYADVPNLVCTCGRTLPLERPWARDGSLFSRLE